MTDHETTTTDPATTDPATTATGTSATDGVDRVIDRAPSVWTGRDDGPGVEHARWHHIVNPLPNYLGPASGGRAQVVREGLGAPVVLVGFASDEGVRRNQGRQGAAEGPAALRGALANCSDPGVGVADLGDVVVAGEDLEDGQRRLGAGVGAVLDAGVLPVVLGGGHEVAYGSGSGWLRRGETWGVLNLDAHLDLRGAERATSGTPFRQLAEELAADGRPFHYAVIGLSRPSNTRTLLDVAARLGVAILDDVDTDVTSAVTATHALLDKVDRVHLTLDLDVLPASVAPGVSAPAAFGVPLAAVLPVLRTVAASGKLGLFEVAELNPRFDIDTRTARTAARCVDEVVRHLTADR